MSDNPYLDRLQREKETDLRQAMVSAADKQPDVEARLRKLASDYQLPIEAVRLDRETVERKAKLDSVDYLKLAKELPATAAVFKDPSNAAIVYDDIENLSGIEKSVRSILQGGYNLEQSALAGVAGFGEGMAGNLEFGADMLSRVTTPIAGAMGVPDVLGQPLSNRMRELRQNQAALREYFTPKADNPIESGIYSGVQSLTQNLLTAPIALATGNPAIGLNTLAAITGGQSYGKAREKGLSAELSALYAGGDAAIEYGTEAAPFLKLVGDVKVGSSFGKTFLNQLALEIPSEQAATLLQDYNEHSILKPDDTFKDFLAARPEAALQTLVATVVGAGGMTAIGHGASRWMSETERAKRAQNQQAAFEQLHKLAQASKVLGRDRDLVGKVVDDVAAEMGGDQVFLNANAFMQSGIADKVLEVMPELSEPLQLALASGGEVPISTRDYVTRLSDQDFSPLLSDHVRLDHEDMTPAEAQEFMTNQSEALKGELESALNMSMDAATVAREIDDIHAQVKGQLNNLGRFKPYVHDRYATLVSQYYGVQAGKFGMTPKELYSQYPVDINSMVGGGKFLSQNKQMTKKLYRGVAKDGQGSGVSMLGKGLYSTPDKKLAKQYGDISEVENGYPSKPLIIRSRDAFSDWVLQNSDFTNIREFNKAYPDPAKFVIEKGFDGIDAGDVVVKYDVETKDNNYNQSAFDQPLTTQTPLPEGQETITVDGVERSTLNSNGQAIHPSVEGIENFWRWFGDSNNTDDGRPIFYYHNSYSKEITHIQDNGTRFDGLFAQSEGKSTHYGKYEYVFAAKNHLNHREFSEKLFDTDNWDDVANVITDNLYNFDIEAISNEDYDMLLDLISERKDLSDAMVEDENYEEGMLKTPEWIIDIFGTDDNGEISWDLQKVRGKLAKLFGADVVDMKDEQGISALLLPGDGVRQISNNTGEFNPENPNILHQTQRGAFNPDTRTITLLENADLSTFLHELGHHFLEMQMQLTQSLMREDELIGTNAMQKQLLTDTQQLLEWFGLSSMEDWFNLDFEQKRVYHEQFAESFEKYLFEGQAPSLALARVFATFRQWLRSVYSQIKSYFDENQINDDIRGVFDRMLATDEEIALAEQTRSMMPLFAQAFETGMDAEQFAEYQAAHNEATSAAMEELALKGLKDLQWLRNARNKTLKNLQREHDEVRRQVRADVRLEVMRQPVYQAWQFLTGKINPEDRLTKAEKIKANPNVVDPEADSLFVAIAKLGGLDYDEVTATWAYDQPGRAKMPVFGKPVVRKTGGVSIETMGERLLNEGYLTADEFGRYDVRELEDKFDAELRGQEQYSYQFNGNGWYGPEVKAGEDSPNVYMLQNGRLDEASIKELDLGAEVLTALKERKMLAKNGLHPDIVANIVPGFDSGAALVLAVAQSSGPQAVIEDLTDERMLMEHAELVDPNALQRAADSAVLNDLRARVLTHEIQALDKAKGQSRPLQAAAKQMAEQVINRLKIKDLKPSTYSRAEARAAKAAKVAYQKGDTGKAAAEKRNQLFNSYAMKAAFEAEDEVEKWLKYFKGFYKPSKSLHIDDHNAILTLLDRYDFKWISNTRLQNNLKIRDWVAKKLAAGEMVPYLDEAILSGPDLANYLRSIEQRDENGDLIYADDSKQAELLAQAIDASQRRYYKEATIEEMRALYDTIQAVETDARLRFKAYTTDSQKTIAEIQEDVSQSIAEHGGEGNKNTGTRTDWIGAKLQGIQGFGTAHIKIPMWARIMDGGQDNGPVWRYFIKPANDRANLESTLKSEAVVKLDQILRPLSKKVAVMDKIGQGKPIAALGNVSLNWQERFAVALNIGNESNFQRLEGGGIAGRLESLRSDQIMAIVSMLSRDDLLGVQQIWDMIEGYKPLIQEQLKRMGQREPTWIKRRPITVRSADGFEVNLRGGYFPVVFDKMASTQARANDQATDLKEAAAAAQSHATTRRSFLKERVEGVKGRPLLLNQQALFGGINDVIHSLAWQEWILDVNRFLKPGGAIDKAIMTYYGAHVVKEFHAWRDDIVLGQRRLDHAMERAAGFLRRNVSLSAMALNINTALLQPLGLFNSVPRVGWQWMGKGLAHYLSDPIAATRQAQSLSPFLANRARNQFRDLNELRTHVSGNSAFHDAMGKYGFWLMVKAQSVADTPTWFAAYYKALATDPLDEKLAIAQADQAVKDSQGGGEDVDLSGIERGSPLLKLFTAFYSYMATTGSLAYGQYRIEANKPASHRERGRLAVDLLMILVLAPQLGWMLKEALQPDGGDDDDDSLAGKMAKEELSFLFGLLAFGREFGSMIQGGLSGYHGPPGLRMLVDSYSLVVQTGQGEFDTAFRKAFINVTGDFTGIPSAQINKTWTGAEALADDDTDNPAALLLGYKK